MVRWARVLDRRGRPNRARYTSVAAYAGRKTRRSDEILSSGEMKKTIARIIQSRGEGRSHW